MTSFRRVSVASLVATFLLVAVGGLVRATKSGLGCGTDWPHCSGRLVPSLETRAEIIEFSHRLTASVVVILLAVLALLAVRHYRRSPAILWPAIGAFVLVMWQAILGMIVVKLELEAESVVLHLGTALALLATLVYLVAAAHVAGGGVPSPDRSLTKRAGLAGGAVLILMLVGSYVTGREAGYVFSDWPLMGGRLVPDLGVELYAIHFLHRALAVIVGGIVVAVTVPVIRKRAEQPIPARLAIVALAGFAAEVLVGAGNVWTALNSALVTVHLAIGAVIYSCLVGIAVVCHPALQTVRQPVVSTQHPILEGKLT
ncbi:MAG: COX15/CtaA family protein [Actinomycetota bacterium]